MPVEPGIVDANVLVYAFDTKAPQHVDLTGATTLYVTSQVLCEFYFNRHQCAARRIAAYFRRCVNRDFRPSCFSFESCRFLPPLLMN